MSAAGQGPVARAVAWVEAAWFPPGAAARLGIVRALVAGYWLQDHWRMRAPLLREAANDPSRFQPVGLGTFLDGPLDVGLYTAIYDGTSVLLALAVLGVGWRVLGPLCAGALLFVETYRVCWGMVYHVHHLAALHLVVLGITPAAAAVSVDAWAARRWPAWRWIAWRPDPAPVAWWYGWPLRLLGSLTAVSYVLAGLAKVLGDAGWGWASGKVLLDQMAMDGLYKELLAPYGANPSIAALYHHPWLLTPAAVLTLVLELGAPFALASPRLGYAWVVGIVGLHAGIALTMDIVFPYQVFGVAYASFLPLERLLPRR